MFGVRSTPTSVTLIVGTLQDALLQQVRSLPLPVALSQLGHSLLEKEAIPPLARMEGDLGTGPRQRNSTHFQNEPWNGSRGPPQTLIMADALPVQCRSEAPRKRRSGTVITGWVWRGFVLFCCERGKKILFVPWKAQDEYTCWSSGCEPWAAAVSSHQALGESDSRIVSRYRVTSKVPLQKGLKCVYLDLYLLALFFFFLYCLSLFYFLPPLPTTSFPRWPALKHPASSSQRDQAAVALGRTTCSQPRDWKREKMR